MMLNSDAKAIADFVKAEPNLAQRILEKIKEFIQTLTGNTQEPNEMQKRLQKAQELFEQALNSVKIEEVQDQQVAQYLLNEEDAKNQNSAIHVMPFHTEEQRQAIQAYHDAVNPEMLEDARRYRADKEAEDYYIPLRRTNDNDVKEIHDALGFDASEYYFFVNRNFFNHVERRHGEKGRHDQSMRNLEDVARALWVIDNHDTVDIVRDPKGEDDIDTSAYQDSNQNPMKCLKYEKHLDGTIYTVVAAGDNANHRIWLLSTYTKAANIKGLENNSQGHGGVQQTLPAVPAPSRVAMGPDVRNENASNSSSTIAQELEGVKEAYQSVLSNLISVKIALNKNQDKALRRLLGFSSMNDLSQHYGIDARRYSSPKAAGQKGAQVLNHELLNSIGVDGTQENTADRLADFLARIDQIRELEAELNNTDGSKYSLPETDNKYLQAIESNDLDTAQQLVDQAAKAAGYNIPHQPVFPAR